MPPRICPPRPGSKLATQRSASVRLPRHGSTEGPVAMEPDRATPPGEASASWQRVARIALAAAVVAFGLWILHEFLAALAWAAVLAIALWPVYRYLQRLLPQRDTWAIGPLLATTVVADRDHRADRAARVRGGPRKPFRHQVLRRTAPPMAFRCPDGSSNCRSLGATIAEWWRTNLSDPVQAEELIGRVNLRTLTDIGARIRRRGRPPARDIAVHLADPVLLFSRRQCR